MDSGGSGEANGDGDGGGGGTGGGATVVIDGVLVEADSPLALVDALLDEVLAGSLAPADPSSAVGLVKVTERIGRKAHAVQLQVQHQIEATGLHRKDGHPSAGVQVRHHGRLSGGEAMARSKTVRMLGPLPLIKAALWAGEIGIAQVQLLGRVFANPRVRGAMELRQQWFLDQAQACDYRLFERRVREWERLIDEDGAEPRNERTHRNRTAKMVQDPIELGWELLAKFAAMQGAAIDDIFRHYTDAEWQADWEKTVAEHGGDACVERMPRTDAQRRADALWQIFQDAAASPNSAVPPGFTHTVVWSSDTYEEMLRRLDGQDPEPLDPDTSTCETMDGARLEPTEAAATSLLEGFRRVVVDAKSVTIDAGEKRRFTGVLRDVIKIQSGNTCVWPGCQCPVTRCEADHVREHGSGGLTNPGNGAPLCGMHNRLKQQGFTLWRDPAGQWHTERPDGTRIPN